MKMLYCHMCKDIVVPISKSNKVNWCNCQRSCCWWKSMYKGLFGCYNPAGSEYVSVLGLHNGILTADFKEYSGWIKREQIEELLNDTPETYIFKKVNSLIVRFKPGNSSDTFFEIPPIDTGVGG